MLKMKPTHSRSLLLLSIAMLQGLSACAETAQQPDPIEPIALPVIELEAQSNCCQPPEAVEVLASSGPNDAQVSVIVDVEMEPAVEPRSEAYIAAEPIAAEPIAVEPIAVEPIAVEPIAVEPILVEPIVVEPLPAPKAIEVEPIRATELIEALRIDSGVAVPQEETKQVAAPQEPAGFDHSHALWSAVLKKHVKGTNFNYGALKKEQTSFNQYLALLHAVTPEELKSWNKNQRFAFWTNVYNAHTIKIVIDNYPLKGIRSLDSGFGLNSVFDKEFIDMTAHHPKGDEDQLSLNDVENTILRDTYKDARVHAAVNCASISCPPLLAEAFVAERLDAQLNAQMKAFINDPLRNEFDLKREKIKASSIFKWFKDDFEREADSVAEYMARYASSEKLPLLKAAKFSYLDYDWKLNDAK